MVRQIEVRVDPGACMSTQMCTVIAPEYFWHDDELGVSRAVLEVTPENEQVVEAAATCPVGAIRLRCIETGEEIAT